MFTDALTGIFHLRISSEQGSLWSEFLWSEMRKENGDESSDGETGHPLS